ncbi:hypothetical protein [Deinococcus roseus]|uniref:Uncharacterized protein n=1 Tax=Deinococcus roseus TaxID=392414 RepID=A0ABQ2DFM8_9DEIO|nr:hypothetical protein [Deinococcus roseus]GGJ54137.1 hypothetical protein GCM10008938_45230 [Deinococcus roseus]
MKRLIYPAYALLIAGVFLPYVALSPVPWTGLSAEEHQNLLTFFPWIQLHVQVSKMSVVNPSLALIFLACALPAGLKPGTHRHPVVWRLFSLAGFWVVLNAVGAWNSMHALQVQVTAQAAYIKMGVPQGPLLTFGAGFYTHVLGMALLMIELFRSQKVQSRHQMQTA